MRLHTAGFVTAHAAKNPLLPSQLLGQRALSVCQLATSNRIDLVVMSVGFSFLCPFLFQADFPSQLPLESLDLSQKSTGLLRFGGESALGVQSEPDVIAAP